MAAQTTVTAANLVSHHNETGTQCNRLLKNQGKDVDMLDAMKIVV
jgi:hypothetical protein